MGVVPLFVLGCLYVHRRFVVGKKGNGKLFGEENSLENRASIIDYHY